MNTHFDPTGTATLYLAHLDRDLTLMPRATLGVEPRDRLRALLSLYALLNEHLVVFDSGVVYNPLLLELFCDPEFDRFGYANLLRDGTLVVARRDNAPTFADLEQHLRNTGTYRPLVGEKVLDYVDLLDDATSLQILSSQTAVYQDYSYWMSALLQNAEFTKTVGLEGVGTAALEHADKRRPSFDGLLRRSFFYEFAEELEERGDSGSAQRLREVSSALSSEAYASRLGVDPAHPRPYQRVIEGLRQQRMTLSPAAPEAVEEILLDVLPIDIDVLRNLEYDVIREIRKGPDFQRYVAAYRAALSETDPARTAYRLQKALREYMVAIRDTLAAGVTNRAPKVRRLERGIKISTYGSGTGAVAVALGGFALGGPAGAGMGLVWGFAGWATRTWLQKRTKAELAAAWSEVPRLGPVVNRGDISQIG